MLDWTCFLVAIQTARLYESSIELQYIDNHVWVKRTDILTNFNYTVLNFLFDEGPMLLPILAYNYFICLIVVWLAISPYFPIFYIFLQIIPCWLTIFILLWQICFLVEKSHKLTQFLFLYQIPYIACTRFKQFTWKPNL